MPLKRDTPRTAVQWLTSNWKLKLEILVAMIVVFSAIISMIGWLSNWRGSLNIAQATQVKSLEMRVDSLGGRVHSLDSLLSYHAVQDALVFKQQMGTLLYTQRLLAVGIFIHDESDLEKRAAIFARVMNNTLNSDSLMYELYQHPHVEIKKPK